MFVSEPNFNNEQNEEKQVYYLVKHATSCKTFAELKPKVEQRHANELAHAICQYCLTWVINISMEPMTCLHST